MGAMSNTPSTETSDAPKTFSDAARLGLASARENALPGLILWALALLIILGFYLLPPVTAALEGLGRLKASGGFLYSAIATGIFGGVIPTVWRYSRKREKDPDAVSGWSVLLFLTLFWAYKGVEIDLVYRGQDLLFGSGASASKIIPKVLVDQFIYNPLWAGWIQILAYWFIEQRFRPSSLVDGRLWRTMGRRVVTILISTWGVWLPIVTIIYSMPSNLQVPLFNIALCFWSLMLASLTKEKKVLVKG
jgi:hypothetical protein